MLHAEPLLDALLQHREHAYIAHHHLKTFDFFVHHQIRETIANVSSPITFIKDEGSLTIQMGGEGARGVYVQLSRGPDGVEVLLPSEARRTGRTYAFDVLVDVHVTCRDASGQETGRKVFPRHRIGAIPVLLHSEMCVLNGRTERDLLMMGECPDDQGGYFIVDGNEKVLITQEALVRNRAFISRDETRGGALDARVPCVAVSAGAATFPRTVYLRMTHPDMGRIEVQIPRLKGYFPVVHLFRALGIETDRAIVDLILRGAGGSVGTSDSTAEDALRPSLMSAAGVYTQTHALVTLSTRTDYRTEDRLLQILSTELFPQVTMSGGTFDAKATYLAFLVRALLRVQLGVDATTDRDSYRDKRLEASGALMAQLFRDNYRRFTVMGQIRLDQEYYYAAWRQRAESARGGGQLLGLLDEHNIQRIFDARMMDERMVSSMKGAWNVDDSGLTDGDYGKEGIVQELARVSYLSYVSQVRRIQTPTRGMAAKLRGPHLLRTDHAGVVCAVETPDGGNIGLTKHLALTCEISTPFDPAPLLSHLIDAVRLVSVPRDVAACTTNGFFDGGTSAELLMNEIPCGTVAAPRLMCEYVRGLRRTGLVNPQLSIRWEIVARRIYIATDSGRCMRPLRIASYKTMTTPPPTWRDALLGSALSEREKDEVMHPSSPCAFPSWTLHPTAFARLSAKKHDEVEGVTRRLSDLGGCVELLDIDEINTCLISMFERETDASLARRRTHIELSPSALLGIPALTVPMLEFNNSNRNVFAMALVKQAVGVYASTFSARLDTLAAVLHAPQLPLITTPIAQRLARSACGAAGKTYGENVIVAIACYTGYNQEDALVVNADSVLRGMFHVTHFHTVSTEEDSDAGIALGYGVAGDDQTSNLIIDRHTGLPRVGSRVVPGEILVGRTQTETTSDRSRDALGLPVVRRDVKIRDASVVAERGVEGIVDSVEVFVKHGSARDRAVRVRIRQVREPELGDKCASRFGQKGVIGRLLPATDMPFTRDGLVPDIIINPNSIPRRMPVGHLLEALLARDAASGGQRSCTTHFSSAPHVASVIDSHKLHGDEILYNGFTGEQIEASIFIGINHYVRLKHMVADKINHRERGPVSALTRQPVKGRNQHGGLRIGEMEQNSLTAHGTCAFLRECFTTKSDGTKLIIDADDGTIRDREPRSDRLASSTFGADLRCVEIPYATKLLTQELHSMGVGCRLVLTDDDDETDDDDGRTAVPDADTDVEALDDLDVDVDEV